jgi:photosystem II stability/assembly factor-like uncharacterized protein
MLTMTQWGIGLAVLWLLMWTSMRGEKPVGRPAWEATLYGLSLAAIIYVLAFGWFLWSYGSLDIDVVSLVLLALAVSLLGLLLVDQQVLPAGRAWLWVTRGICLVLALAAAGLFAAELWARSHQPEVACVFAVPETSPTPAEGPTGRWFCPVGTGGADVTALSVPLGDAPAGTAAALDRSGNLFVWDGEQGQWRCASDDLASERLVGVAFSPTFKEDRRLYLATNEGAFLSADAGKTWEKVFGEGDAQNLQAVAVGPRREGHDVFLAGRGGLFRSKDRGKTWQQVGAELGTSIPTALAISPAYDRDGTLWAGTSRGIFRSNNGGDTWQPACDYLRAWPVDSLHCHGDPQKKPEQFTAVIWGKDTRLTYTSAGGENNWKRFGMGLGTALPIREDESALASYPFLTARRGSAGNWSLLHAGGRAMVRYAPDGQSWQKLRLDGTGQSFEACAIPPGGPVLLGGPRGVVALDVEKHT